MTFIFYFSNINEANGYMDIISSHTTAGTGNIGIHTITKKQKLDWPFGLFIPIHSTFFIGSVSVVTVWSCVNERCVIHSKWLKSSDLAWACFFLFLKYNIYNWLIHSFCHYSRHTNQSPLRLRSRNTREVGLQAFLEETLLSSTTQADEFLFLLLFFIIIIFTLLSLNKQKKKILIETKGWRQCSNNGTLFDHK